MPGGIVQAKRHRNAWLPCPAPLVDTPSARERCDRLAALVRRTGRLRRRHEVRVCTGIGRRQAGRGGIPSTGGLDDAIAKDDPQPRQVRARVRARPALAASPLFDGCHPHSKPDAIAKPALKTLWSGGRRSAHRPLRVRCTSAGGRFRYPGSRAYRFSRATKGESNWPSLGGFNRALSCWRSGGM